MLVVEVGDSPGDFSFGLEIGGNLPYTWDLYERVPGNGSPTLVPIAKGNRPDTIVPLTEDVRGRAFQFRANVLNQGEPVAVRVMPVIRDGDGARHVPDSPWEPTIPLGGGKVRDVVSVVS